MVKIDWMRNQYTSTMFSLAIYLDNDSITIDPFSCTTLCAYMRNCVIVANQGLMKMTNDLQALTIPVKEIVVIASDSYESSRPIRKTKDLKSCISYLTAHHQSTRWWVVGDNEFSNEMISNGVVMDVHLSKSYATGNMPERVSVSQCLLPQSVSFDKDMLDQPQPGFKLVSSTMDLRSDTRSHRHYARRNHEELSLLEAMKDILANGFHSPNRTGIDTVSVFGKHFEYRLIARVDPKTNIRYYQFPLLTTKKMFIRGIFEELKWFLSGGTDSKVLEDKGINIWKGNTSREFLDSNGLSHYHEGETGPIYGFQWKHFGATYVPGKHDYTGEGIDQIQNVIQSLKTDPFSRRHIISGWNPLQLSEMCLPPCHVLYQFMVHEHDGNRYLSLSMYQRSADMFLGVPFNIASCSMFLVMMAHRVGMVPYKFIHNIGDAHIYSNHLDATNIQVNRMPFMFPYVRIVDDCEIEIQDYNSHRAIKAGMAA